MRARIAGVSFAAALVAATSGYSAVAPKPMTAAQAKKALYAAQRIRADDRESLAFQYDYIFVVAEIKSLRPVGPQVGGGYRAFEIGAYISLLQPIRQVGGSYREPPNYATFCLRPTATSFRLTGFDTTFGPYTTRVPTKLGCTDSATTRRQVGSPIR